MPITCINFDLRHPAEFGVSGPRLYAAALDMIEWAEAQGFSRVSFGEHHQSPDGYIPCPLLFAAAVGGRTSRIRVRISVLLASLYDPVRLAEEVAVADLAYYDEAGAQWVIEPGSYSAEVGPNAGDLLPAVEFTLAGGRR